MSRVTYTGPVDEVDPTERYRIRHEGTDYVFRKGWPVDDVPDAVVDRLQDDEAHSFELGEAADPYADVDFASAQARALADENDVDPDELALLVGPVSVDDVRGLIEGGS